MIGSQTGAMVFVVRTTVLADVVFVNGAQARGQAANDVVDGVASVRGAAALVTTIVFAKDAVDAADAVVDGGSENGGRRRRSSSARFSRSFCSFSDSR